MLIICSLFSTVFVSFFTATIVYSSIIESTYLQGDIKIKLKVSIHEVTTDRGQEDLISYSVYYGGNFIHGENYGGRFFSCRLSIEPKIFPLHSKSGQIGWMIAGSGICGNTHSYRVELVVPVQRFSGRNWSYMSKTIISKLIPSIVPKHNAAIIWFFEQNWGHGGTSTSVFVPRKLVVLPAECKIRKGNVLKDINYIEVNPPEKWLKPNFIGLFLAGIEDANPDLMEYAIQNFYQKEDSEWCEVFMEKGTKAHLQSLVNKVKATRQLYNELTNALTWEMDIVNQ